MGLHAQIHQTEHEVSIALAGEFHDPEYGQLAAIVEHFRNRGCRRFVLNVEGVARMNAATKASLRRLIGRSPSPAYNPKDVNSAIRLRADNPAVRPQTDCGDLLFAS